MPDHANRYWQLWQRAAPGRGGLVWNILTGLILLVMVCVAGLFLMIFLNPYNPLNPFPPPTPLPTLPPPTATVPPTTTPRPTWTASPSPEPTLTFTPRPTATPPPSATPIFLFATGTVTTTVGPGAAGGMPFIIQGDPVAVRNIYHTDLGCNWMGVAGQVVDINGSPIQGQLIQLGGFLPGVSGVGGLTLTGLTPQLGPGFYEFQLADEPLRSNSTLWVQVLNQEGTPLSEKIYFQTFDECERNLIIVDFRQVR